MKNPTDFLCGLGFTCVLSGVMLLCLSSHYHNNYYQTTCQILNNSLCDDKLLINVNDFTKSWKSWIDTGEKYIYCIDTCCELEYKHKSNVLCQIEKNTHQIDKILNVVNVGYVDTFIYITLSFGVFILIIYAIVVICKKYNKKILFLV